MGTRSGKTLKASILHQSPTASRRRPRISSETSPRDDGEAAHSTQKRGTSNSTLRTSPAADAEQAASRSPCTPIPKLPLEIFQEIAAHLDEPSLVRFLAVSRTFWEVGAQILYRHISIAEPQFYKLVRRAMDQKYKQYRRKDLLELRRQGVSRLSPRMQRALGFIQQLYIKCPLSMRGVTALWDATTPGVPLFPSVHKLRLVDSPNRRPITSRDLYRPKPPGEDVVIFDKPDVCIMGHWAMERILYFPLRDMKRLAAHVTLDFLFRDPRPQTWDSYHVYDSDSRQTRAQLVDHYQTLLDRCPPLFRPIQLCLETDDAEFMDAIASLNNRPTGDDPHNKLVFVFNDDAPACTLCGGRWQKGEDDY